MRPIITYQEKTRARLAETYTVSHLRSSLFVAFERQVHLNVGTVGLGDRLRNRSGGSLANTGGDGGVIHVRSFLNS